MAFILFDEHLGQVHPAGEIRFQRPTATVRELIRARVELEVERRRNEVPIAAIGIRSTPPSSRNRGSAAARCSSGSSPD